MKRKFFIFILFLIGLVVCTTKLINVASDEVDVSSLNQYELETISVHDYDSLVNYDGVLGDPIDSTIFTHCNNIHFGYVRTINRCVRLLYRFFPRAFLIDGKVIDFALVRNFPSNHSVFCSVKLSANHGFIRLCKLLI